MSTLDLANHAPVIPVIVHQQGARCGADGGSLARRRINVLEATLSTLVGLQAMEVIAKAVLDVIAGTGTVRSIKDAQVLKDVGCKSPSSPAIPARSAVRCVK